MHDRTSDGGYAPPVARACGLPKLAIDWIEGADSYARLRGGSKVYMLREALASLERRLDPRRFLRVHRSTIVNLTRVRAVEAQQRGDATSVLSTGARVKVMRGSLEQLESRLEALHDQP